MPGKTQKSVSIKMQEIPGASVPEAKISMQDVLGEAVPREEMLQRIHGNPVMLKQFSSFSAKDQERVLAYLCGEKSLQILSDKFFKKILNPEEVPERVESLLSAIYDKPVKILHVLSREGAMVKEGSQVIMDIIVRIADESTVNIEMQRLGYEFPGERTSCYLADMIMRQYEMTKSERGQKFSYHDMKPINMIVIMDRSSQEFKVVAPEYLHKREVSYSSGVEVTTLEQVTYISLDTFRERAENRLESALDAWLTFFTAEEPADVIRLVSEWPMFLPMYHDIASFRKDPEGIMGYFSEALYIMDQNTTKYMIDSMHQKIEDQSQKIEDQSHTIKDMASELKRLQALLAENGIDSMTSI